MPARISRFTNGVERKRKAHEKSRKGCGNCKLRRVKCDEARPQCKKCLAYGVSCNYDGKQASLDLSAQGAFQVDLSEKPPDGRTWDRADAIRVPGPYMKGLSDARNLVTIINDSLEADAEGGFGALQWGAHWCFTQKHLRIIERFQQRTVVTMGSRRVVPAYRDSVAIMAFRHTFLMHMVLSVTLLHDLHLIGCDAKTAATNIAQTALQHWNIATTLFNGVLSRPIEPHSRDALWATAALMGCSVFAYIETSDVEQAWPLKTPDPHDLSWLKLSEGKKAIWNLVNPARPDSIFSALSCDHQRLSVYAWIDENDISRIPEPMRKLFDIDEGSTVDNNVYHLPALIFSHLKDETPNQDNVLNFLAFMGNVTPEFRTLLEIKDPRALLLVSWWFKQLQDGEIWWLKRRASVEGESIRVYLDRWFGGEKGLSKTFDGLGNGRMGVEKGVPDVSWSWGDWRWGEEEGTCFTQ
ncbi:hypothetical protein CC78DRAFT_540201 [Lojkania enalia]|uniref:Zn(2)-C6 fungal-type domain-containing protein n=1 Tax=Lojkania enalia TaxID=147567 RepID=A0A9P4TPU4_9PLEO|nr:hypothetical protein CC78DRAFT_540201 [Didymosphaeria enalia]